MEEQREIQINKKDFQFVLLAILIPLIISFALQSFFGEFTFSTSISAEGYQKIQNEEAAAKHRERQKELYKSMSQSDLSELTENEKIFMFGEGYDKGNHDFLVPSRKEGFSFSGVAVAMNDLSLDKRYFTTIFGNVITTYHQSDDIRVYRDNREIPEYLERIPYFLKGVYADMAYTIVISLVLIAGYFFRKKFRIKLK